MRLASSVKFLVVAVFYFVISSALGAAKVADYLRQSDEWFRSVEAKEVAANILSFQSDAGDWPKNTNTTVHRFEGDRATLHGTFDNSATLPELRFLAKLFSVTKAPEYEKAFLKGFDHVLEAQYANGGWPQTSPPSKGYDRHITFNDDAMVNILNFVRDIAREHAFDFVAVARRERAAKAFDRGIDCILKCQIRVDGQPTLWCAQHDEINFSPAKARSYELPSFSGSESAGIVRLLMTIPKPSAEIVAAVDGAVAFFERIKLTGIREVKVDDPQSPKGWDKRIVEDPGAPPLWARFYDLKTLKPMFVDRDGLPKEKLSDIGYERRNGYSWLGNSPARVLAEYPAWKKSVATAK